MTNTVLCITSCESNDKECPLFPKLKRYERQAYKFVLELPWIHFSAFVRPFMLSWTVRAMILQIP